MNTREQITDFHCPRFAELPEIDLYARQVVQYITHTLHPLYPADTEIITGAMLNNYIKQGVLPPPIGKSYQKEHVCKLLVLSILKTVFRISDIGKLFQIQNSTYPLEIAYDYFCSEFENALKEAFFFTGLPLPSIETKRTEQTILIRAMVLAVSNKIYVEQSISEQDEPVQEK